MRTKVSVTLVATGLTLALISSLPTASAAPATSTAGTVLYGTLAQNGGVAGYASANGWSAAAGQPSSLYGKYITTSVSGATGSLSVETNPTNLNVGSVIGEGTAAEVVTATGMQVKFKDTTPPFFSVQDMLYVFPPLTFTFATRNKDGSLAYDGHYALNLATGEVIIDDSSTKDRDIPNGHVPMSRANSWRQDNELLNPNNTVTKDRLVAADKGCIQPGLITLNTQTVRVYQGYAQALPLTMTASVPLSFGYKLNQVTTGSNLTVTMDQALSQSKAAWTAALSSPPQSNVPINFNSFDWQSVFTSTALNALNATVQQSFADAFSKGLSYDQFISLITNRTIEQMSKDIDVMVTELIQGMSTCVAALSIRVPKVPNYPQWNGVLSMDNVLGTTTFPADIGEPPKVMYPNLHTDLAAKLIPMIKDRVGKQWYTMAFTQMTSAPITATVSRSLQPSTMVSLTPTDVTALGNYTPPVITPSSTAPSTHYVQLSTETWRANFGSNTQKITVTSDQSWTATSDADWLTAKTRSGVSGAIVKVATTRNTLDERTGHIRFTSGDASATLTVVQSGQPYVRTVPGVWYPTKPAATKTFTVTMYSTNGTWTAKSSANWLHVVKQSGNELTLSVDKSRTSKRTGKVVVSSGLTSFTLHVRQSKTN